MFKRLLFASLIGIFFIGLYSVQAASKLDIYFFYADGCPHCAKEEVFLDKLERDYSNRIIIHRYEVSNNADNVKLFMEFGEKFKTSIDGVPFTALGERYFSGYLNDDTTGANIEAAVQKELAKEIYNTPPPSPPSDGPIVLPDDDTVEVGEPAIYPKPELFAGEDNSMNLPILGSINPKSFSLPLITIILGALDGFNPCAMWALLFLISLLLGMKDKKRMWILGITFVVASATVYFLFMAAWLNIILLLGLVIWVRLIIGLVALAGGVWNIRDYFKNKVGGCKVTNDERRRRVFDKLKIFTQQKQVILAVLGIVVLAFAVNLIELVCSAGLPAVYTQILVLNDLANWQYYLYILLYIFFFMLDDLIIFFIAMITLQMIGISTKYSKWSSLLGGLLMIIIGLLMLFKHEWLMFS